MKLNSKIHGVIDYVVVLFLLASPSQFQFPEVTSAVTYMLGGIHLVLTLSTNFELGVFKFIPLKIHGLVELTVSFALVGVAFYLGKTDGAISRNFYLLFAFAVFLTWIVSDYQSSTRTDQ